MTGSTIGIRDVDADDSVLLARARRGEREALEALLSRHLDAVYDFALRILGDRDLAQDAAQDACLNALRGLPHFRGRASFRTWLLRITANAARSIGRHRGRRREKALEDPDLLPGSAPDPSEGVALRGEAERIERVLARLPEKQRLVVTLRVHQRLGYREIAEITGSTEGSARVNYHLGIKRLRDLLQ